MPLKPPAFDPTEVPESNATAIPPPYQRDNQNRFNRRLGDHAGLSNFGVTMTRIVPGGQSSCRHAHSRQDEFVYIREGEATLETDAGQQVMKAGSCIGFPAGTGDAHRFLNKTDKDVVFLVVGDRSKGDEVVYPDVDLAGVPAPDGKYRFTRKDGSSY